MSIQDSPIYDSSKQTFETRTHETVWTKLSFIFSRENLGLQSRTIDFATAAARKIMDNRDAVVFVDGTAGVVAMTLPPANSWGAGKTPVLVFVRVDASANGCTYTPSGADTVNGAGGATVVNGLGTVSRLVSNGVNGYWKI